jgi:hypothetical protein
MPNASIDSPIDDLTYDVVTVLQNKAKALEAYDKYIGDAADDLEVREAFEQIKRQDQEHVRVLKEVLARLLDEDLGYVDEDEDDYDEDEDAEEAVQGAGFEAGDHRGEEVATFGDDPPPRRGESTQRRGA